MGTFACDLIGGTSVKFQNITADEVKTEIRKLGLQPNKAVITTREILSNCPVCDNLRQNVKGDRCPHCGLWKTVGLEKRDYEQATKNRQFRKELQPCPA